MDNIKIAATIVTYNRLENLKNTINALTNQTFPIEFILVIDNCSSDGTKQFLTDLEKKIDKLIVIYLNSNTGGAGGFSIGTIFASTLPVEYIWLMDDDVVPAANCLEELVKRALEGYKIVQPQRYNPDGTAFPNIGRLNLQNPLRSLFINGNSHQDTIDHVPFEGPLIKKDVFSDIGFPDPTFFILGDDVDFSIRFIHASNKIGLAPLASLHRAFEHNTSSVLDWKSYYEIRNFIRIDKAYSSNPVTFIRASKNYVRYLFRAFFTRDFFGFLLVNLGFLHGFLGISGTILLPSQWKDQLLSIKTWSTSNDSQI